jgi:uncharacterized membrane protein YcjF (UPF0283 family)
MVETVILLLGMYTCIAIVLVDLKAIRRLLERQELRNEANRELDDE